MSDHVSELDLQRYRTQANTAFREGSSQQKVWEKLTRSGCPENTATRLTGYPKRLRTLEYSSDRHTTRLQLFVLLLIVSSVAATYCFGYVVHRVLERRLINSAFGAGTYESGVHIIDKRQNLSNGRQLPARHGTILTATTVATYFITFSASILTIRAFFPTYVDGTDSKA